MQTFLMLQQMHDALKKYVNKQFTIKWFNKHGYDLHVVFTYQTKLNKQTVKASTVDSPLMVTSARRSHQKCGHIFSLKQPARTWHDLQKEVISL